MKNITKLKCWATLQEQNFERVNYRFRGILTGIGADNGLIEIEPCDFGWMVWGEMEPRMRTYNAGTRGEVRLFDSRFHVVVPAVNILKVLEYAKDPSQEWYNFKTL